MGAMKRFVGVSFFRVKRAVKMNKINEHVVPPTHMNIGPSTTITTFSDSTDFTCNVCTQC